ncbi:glycoside hydrolase family 61 protein [Rhizoctonia solani]|uniref:lytic cellulose monooxygenase (C4-dehydrogenating) n=1 Tax=Rhizoctonia solani TaxID=456999 RepID=A0A8H7GZC1_9AGAM|nr:glycoside hydrolase family 61 protein [Rhizoctonia solani]KAF8668249.1 Glycosyl hydrolase family 61 [Rhizoctonia solani]QRW16581.1 glycoside hydrolase family 61 protein [Rhizoctonia solani]
MLFSSLVSFVALAAAGVNAHGYVDKIIADGKTYNGPIPGETNPKSPIRRISTIDPYKNPKGSGITCGEKSQLASVVAPITAGSDLTLSWVAHPNQAWPHEMGPLITWMAKVPAGQTADKFDASKGDFFKVHQEGQEGKKWYLERLMKLGTTMSIPIPKELEDGDYIMRHEIIALHLADNKGGAEFYTSCFQLKVTGGTGTAKTTASETVRFPGAYDASNPGIYVPKVFDNGFKYKFPGPAIATFANTGNTTEPDTTTTESSSAPTKTSSSKPVEPTSTGEPDDDDECGSEDPTSSSAAPEPTATEECTGDDDESATESESATPTSTSKYGKPTGKSHKPYHNDRRGHIRSWTSRMEKRIIGAPRK